MYKLDYQTPSPNPNIDLRSGGWQSPLSCVLAVLAVGAIVCGLMKVMFTLLILAWLALALAMSRRPRVRPSTVLALVVNLVILISVA